MKINANSGAGKFTPHPATDGLVRGVIVDVTEPERKQTAYGEKEVFRVVIESELTKPEGDRYCVWSRGFTPSLNEKASFRKFLRSAFGRDVAETDADDRGEVDIDRLLIGHAVQMLIVNEEHDGIVYANISAIVPDRSENPLAPSGNYIRRRDRAERDPAGAPPEPAFLASSDAGSCRQNWQTVRVHVGRHRGALLGDLEPSAVERLITHWLPEFRAGAAPTADDRRLAGALEAAEAVLREAETHAALEF